VIARGIELRARRAELGQVELRLRRLEQEQALVTLDHEPTLRWIVRDDVVDDGSVAATRDEVGGELITRQPPVRTLHVDRAVVFGVDARLTQREPATIRSGGCDVGRACRTNRHRAGGGHRRRRDNLCLLRRRRHHQ